MTATSWADAATHPLDVVAVGAINRDRILADSAVERHRRFEAIEPGEEERFSDEEMTEFLKEIAGEPFTSQLGGSGLNVIRAMAAMDCGLTLGVLAVEGLLGNEEEAARSMLAESGIDYSGVLVEPDFFMGDCVSEPDAGGRKLATCPRANVRMAHRLAAEGEAAARYCARARLLHITSFLDDTTPIELARLIRNVRRLRPGILISVDPGFEWARAARGLGSPPATAAALREILRSADFVLLNEREFHALGLRRRKTPDSRLAARIFKLLRESDGDRVHPRIRAAVVLKQAGGSMVYEGRNDAIVPLALHHAPVPLEEIVDDTGTGDVFAAGLITGLLRASSEPIRFGARLGGMLAREKLGHIGDAAHPHLQEVTRRALKALGNDDVTQVARLHRAMRKVATDSETIALVLDLCRRLPRTFDAVPGSDQPAAATDLNERDLQAWLYRLLRWVFDDVEWEHPRETVAGSAPRVDLALTQHGLAIELKVVRTGQRPKQVVDELLVDFGRYRHSSRAMVAVIWDPGRRIPDPEKFEREVTSSSGDFRVGTVVLQPGS